MSDEAAILIRITGMFLLKMDLVLVGRGRIAGVVPYTGLKSPIANLLSIAVVPYIASQKNFDRATSIAIVNSVLNSLRCSIGKVGVLTSGQLHDLPPISPAYVLQKLVLTRAMAARAQLCQ